MPSSHAANDDAATWPPGPGAMARRVRTLDWGATALGWPARWPVALRQAVQVCLDSALPMAVLWGDDLVVLHNDALAALAPPGEAPALGQPYREARPQAWAAQAPELAHVMETGEPRTVPGLWGPLDDAPGGALAHAADALPRVASFSCTALRDARGEVAGVLAIGLSAPARGVLERLVHELRDPLAPIRSSLELLRMSRDGMDVALVHEMLERQIHAMVRVIDGLLAEPGYDQLPLATSSSSLLPPPHAATPESAATAALAAALEGIEPGEAGAVPRERERAHARAAAREQAQEHDPQRALERERGAARLPELGPRQQERRRGPRDEHEDPPVVGWPRRRRLAERLPDPHTDDSPAIARRVLVVDDHHDAADSLALLLSHLGTEVKVAYDGETALEELRHWIPEAVLLDLDMPEMDGFEVARRIRQMPSLRGLPLIALTGWGQGTDMQRTKEAGIDHHLVKPVRLDVLVEVLASLDEAEQVVGGGRGTRH